MTKQEIFKALEEVKTICIKGGGTCYKNNCIFADYQGDCCLEVPEYWQLEKAEGLNEL